MLSFIFCNMSFVSVHGNDNKVKEKYRGMFEIQKSGDKTSSGEIGLIPAFTTNAMTSGFLLLISHGWVVTFQDSHRTVFTFRSWLDLLDVVLAFWISILKISKLLQNCLHRVIDITSFEKHLESSLDRTPNFCQIWWYFVPGVCI